MKAIVFDMDDTLYEQIEPFQRACKDVFGGRLEPDIRRLFAARSRRSNEVFEDAMAGKISMEEMFIYRGQMAFADLGYQITPQEALDFQRAYERNQEKITLSDTMKEILTICRDVGALLGIITNGPTQHQRKKTSILGMERWIDAKHVIISEECGASKPDPAIFRCAQERLGVSASDCIFVGDSYENDIVGAQHAGWKSIWLNKLGRKLPAGAVCPEYMVRSETELLAWVKETTERLSFTRVPI